MSDLTTDDPPAEATGVAGNQVSKLPWVILLILLGSTTINYIDRITLSVLAPTLRDEFGMSNTQYAWVLNAFQFSYLIMYSVGGRLADLLGVRRALSLFVVWWSVASVLHAFSVGAKSLAAFRFVLAMGEGGNWPTVMKAAAERVPGAMRSFAVGVVNSGSSLGSMLAPPLVGWLAVTWGWRPAFIVTGLIGFLWLPFWISATRQNRQSGRPIAEKRVPWVKVVRFRQAWAVFLGRMMADGVWGFYIFWLPEYLNRERGLNLAEIGAVAWIPFLVGDLGNLSGGGVTSWLISRGWTVNRARKTVLFVAAAASTVGIAAAYTSSLIVAMATISLAAFFFMIWSVNLLNLPADFFPPSYVGTVFGFSGTGSGLGTLITTAMIGWVLDLTGSYIPVLIGVGLLTPLAQLVVALVGGRIEKVKGFRPDGPNVPLTEGESVS